MTSGTWKWLETTEELQKDYFGNDLWNKTGDDRDKHILYNFTAAINELNEMLDEAPSWKPWSSEVGLLNREAFRDEIVDTLHFVANLLLLANISEEELWAAYREKQQRNRDRMSKQGGYQASKNKCPNCKRELDKIGAYTIEEHTYVQENSEHYLDYSLKCVGCSQVFPYRVNINEETLPGKATA